MGLGLVALSGQGYALDLTPHRSFRELEGFQIPIVKFNDGERTVFWQPPAGWPLSGGGSTVTLYPPNQALATMSLSLRDSKETIAPSADTGPELLNKWATALLAADATDIHFIKETENPFTLRELPIRELTFDYLSQNRRLTASLFTVQLDENQSLLLTVSSLAPEFDVMRLTVIKSMFHWDWH